MTNGQPTLTMAEILQALLGARLGFRIDSTGHTSNIPGIPIKGKTPPTLNKIVRIRLELFLATQKRRSSANEDRSKPLDRPEDELAFPRHSFSS